MKSYKYNLPAQSTPFVDRESEMAEIVSLLRDQYCRLLTLFGPGGIGNAGELWRRPWSRANA